ncbi:MAG: peptidyl-tRNA hydrolase, PTH1 family [Parcubacteria bacterium C7867-005]|nr:MAG: peptidyl-tRNA hydrolase, PTH1 family [Parcubacteria bacterium C7867-005]
MYIVVGLGNPGEEYKETRHNTGRMVMDFLTKKDILNTKFVHLDTFMNKSGAGVAKVVKSKKSAEKLVVVYDDLDLPIGTMKVSYDRSSGGHRGVESIIRALKTQAFIRIRVGISPSTPSGKLKKPQGEKDVEKFIMGKFGPKEKEMLKKVFKHIPETLEALATDGLQRAMTVGNTK